MAVRVNKGLAQSPHPWGRYSDLVGPLSLDIIHPEDRLRVGRIWAELAEHPDSVTTFRFREQRADGDWRWVEATAADLRREPSVAAIVINRRHITAGVQAQQPLEVPGVA